MSNPIDKLFKDSLGEHKIVPSAEAWEKVQSGLSKKSKWIIMWRMAAVLALLGALIGMWYFLPNNESPTPQIVIQENDENQTTDDSTVNTVKPTIAQTHKTPIRKNTRSVSEDKEQPKKVTDEDIASTTTGLTNEVMNNPIKEEEVLVVQTTKSEKPIVIEFTLASPPKAPVTEVAQTNGEGSSGLMKILVIARDVKNGDSDLGVLREGKNQLFALDFRKDKTKRN